MVKIPEDWSQHLPPERQQHFNYSAQQKHRAALAWLLEQQNRVERRGRIRWLIFIVAALTLLAGILWHVL